MRECPRCKTINDDDAGRCDCGLVFATGVITAPRPGSRAAERARTFSVLELIGRFVWGVAGIGVIALVFTIPKDATTQQMAGGCLNIAFCVGVAMCWDGATRRPY
jgi:hypothetical protein